ncbi:hypothetical protein ElyMa_004696900 [Elysia marginata]|uniref:Uncharacterized protein n=1 Tax=Elysia marginata TaxID=1093978 RepID=A0AAV4I6U2_9GAST|nr:hypothetical protein ElyMa_004696900 [Elysia marginata]
MRRDVMELKEVYSGMRKDISYMAEDIELIKERVRELEEKTEYAERYSRRENILIYGIKEEEKQFQDSKALVLKVLTKVSHNRNWDDRQIVRAHRLGQKKGEEHTRPPIVHFLHHMDKMYMLGKRDELKKLGLGVAMAEVDTSAAPPPPSRDNLEPNARQQRESPAQRPEQPRPHREAAKTAMTSGCPLSSSSSRPTLPCREDLQSEVAPDSRVPLPELQQEKPPPQPSASQAPPT